MVITTSQGHRLETLEAHGRSTPFFHRDYVVIRVAVDGRAYDSFQLPASTWQEELATLPEKDFWQNVADAALSMGDMRQLMQ